MQNYNKKEKQQNFKGNLFVFFAYEQITTLYNIVPREKKCSQALLPGNIDILNLLFIKRPTM